MPSLRDGFDLLVPCDAALHWRYIELLVPFGEDQFDKEGLRSQLPDRRGNFWLISDGLGAEYHSQARILSTPANSDAGLRNLLEVETYRTSSRREEGDAAKITHADFFTAFAASVRKDEIQCFPSVGLIFPAASSTWQAALMATPPDMPELPGELGRIGLAGLIFRFKDSAAGLLEARLESSPSDSDYRVDVRFSVSLHVTELDSIYQVVLSKAEQFASLFVRSE